MNIYPDNSLPRPAVVDGNTLTIPISRALQRTIERWMQDHYEDLLERLQTTPGYPAEGDLLLAIPDFERYVTEDEMKR